MKSNDVLKKLFKLMEENPELPIVPMVGSEVVGEDDCGHWIGSFNKATVDEYTISPSKWYDGIFFKSNDDVFGTLEQCLPDEEFEALPEDENKCRARYNALPWKKAIIVYIEAWEG